MFSPFIHVSFFQSLSNRLPEGQHLLAMVQDSYNKAMDTVPTDKQDALRDQMTTLRSDWDTLNLNVKEKLADARRTQNSWTEFLANKQRMEQWLAETEKALEPKPDTKGELSEMKTLLERYKALKADIGRKSVDLESLANDAKDLNADQDEIRILQSKWDKVNNDCNSRINDIEAEIDDCSSYHQSLQEVEKWLLQISFQLMAHNSLYISDRQQTLEQIKQHEALLGEIQKYRTNLDDLNAKGQRQIDRYKATPNIKNTIEEQLKNIQESYDSLLHTSLTIKGRLHDSLAKFQEYEDTLDSIMKNLEEYEPIIESELDAPTTSLPMAEAQLKKAQVMF